jgi:hypothetical protein
MAVPVGLVFDCTEPKRLGAFWIDALGYVERPPPPGYSTWDEYDADHGLTPEEQDAGYPIADPGGVGPTIFFQRVPESKVVKNRVHVDVKVGGGVAVPFEERVRRIEAGVEPLVANGATFLRRNEDPEDYFIVMQDPEGNEFCLV